MNIIYLDCFAGISGDMTVAALLELGVPLPVLRERLATLPLPEGSYSLAADRVERQHIAATKFDVQVTADQHHRTYRHIKDMIQQSPLNVRVKELSLQVFSRLAAAEAKVHGVKVEEVHFHEVGAIDSIIDIVGTAVCLDYLQIEEVHASSLPLGSGFVQTAHGRLPVPAPATAELLKGMHVHPAIGPGERVTPTGAAIVAALASTTGTAPSLRIHGIGYGAGSRDYTDTPNILRVFMGEGADQPAPDIYMVETNIDDMNPEIYGFLMDHLLACGALDVTFTSLQMKKNRPGTKLSMLCHRQQLHHLAGEVLRQSTAIGVRYYPVERIVLDRTVEQRETSLGPIFVKVMSDGGKKIRISPEYRECLRISQERGLPLLDVYRIVERETAGT